jgi:GAF domain-containing protein
MNNTNRSNHDRFIEAMMSVVLEADEQDLAEDALVAGEDLTGTSKHMRARFLDRVARAQARDLGLEQMILAEVGAALATCSTHEQTLGTVAELAVRRMAQMCVVLTLDDGGASRRLTVVHEDPAKSQASRALENFPANPLPTITLPVLETGRPQLFDEESDGPLELGAQEDEHRRALRELGVKSALVVPLLSSTGVLGVLALGSSRPRQFRAWDIGLATEFAFRAVLAIETMRRHEAEQRAIRARDEKLEAVAHDLRSPLHSINLAAQLLERKLASAGEPSCQRHLDVILESVVRADRLLRDLMDISRSGSRPKL